MGNRTPAQSSLLPRVTLCIALGAGVGEAVATLLATNAIDFGDVAYVVALVAPFGVLAWMSRRYRDRRVMKPLLFLTVLCLAAWGLSHLIGDALRFHTDPDYRKIQRWAPFIVACGNWLAVAAAIWAERLLSRFSRRK